MRDQPVRADILTVAQDYGATLRKCGGEFIGPCPVCGGTDRFGVNAAKQIWNCRQCGKGGDAIELVRHVESVSYRDAVERLTGEKAMAAPQRRPSRPIEPSDYEREQHRKAVWLWSLRRPAIGSPVERYLREARGYTGLIPATLGFLAPTKPEHHAAMIAAFGVCDESEPGVITAPIIVEAIHLTLLKPNGSGKAAIARNKLIVGSPQGQLIVLAPPNDLLGLAITEGIEDALSVHAATGLGAWAAGAAGFMPALASVVPIYIDCVTVFEDADKAGQRSTPLLAEGLSARGIHADILPLGGAP